MLSFVISSALLLAGQSLGQNTSGGTSSPLCAQASILAQGIAINIVDQQNELATVNNIANILKTNPVDMTQFTVAKNDLLTFINNGIAIRQMNQQIMPKGNAATMGLAVVANAQLAELGLATNLTGNPTNDNPIVAQLQQDFTGGIQKNMQNQQQAIQGCAGASTTPGTGATGTTGTTGTTGRARRL